jgi:hypothetical protein
MNKERFSQIVDEVYQKYTIKYMGHEDIPSKDLFLFEIKKNKEFSERWGLGIEERELDRDDRYDLMLKITGHSQENINMRKKINNFEGNNSNMSYHEEWLNSFSVPTKLITMTYNSETIEIYE